MKLTHACILTGKMEPMVAFYEEALQLRAERAGTTYAEFRTPGR